MRLYPNLVSIASLGGMKYAKDLFFILIKKTVFDLYYDRRLVCVDPDIHCSGPDPEMLLPGKAARVGESMRGG